MTKIKALRVVVTLVAISFLLPSMATFNYEKAVCHQEIAEQAYKYSLVSMMKAHIDSMWQEIYEMDWDSYDKNRERLDRGYYKLCGDYYYLTDTLDSALYYYNLAQPLFKRYEGAGYYGIIHEEKAQLFYKMKDWEKAKSYADTLKSLYNDTLGFKDADKAIYWSSISDLCQAREAVDDYRNGYTAVADRKFENSLADINACLKILSPSDGELYYDVLRTRAKILMLKSEQDGAYNDQARKDFQTYFDGKKEQISSTLLSMTEEQREQFWMQERRFITDCYRLEGHAPELLYDVTLYAKGILLHLGKSGAGNHERLSFTTYKGVQQSLPKNSCALEFIQYEKNAEQHMGVLVLKNSGAPQFVYVGKVDDMLDAQVDNSGMTVRQILSNNSVFHQNYIYNDASWFNLVWTSELIQSIKGCQKMYFAPDGFLHEVAIEYILPQELARIDCYRLSSTRVLFDKTTRLDKKTLRGGPLLLIGGLFYGTEAKDTNSLPQLGNDKNAFLLLKPKSPENSVSLSYLQGTKDECNSIYGLRNNPLDKYLKTTGATEKSFRSLCDKYKIIHVSTHGFYNGGYEYGTEIKPAASDHVLSTSGLFLSGCVYNLNDKGFNPDYLDGILSSRELSKCDMSNVELFVASACKTGVGDVTGDGVYGVQRGIKAAGAKAVIASLWNVDDKSTSCFFQHFYQLIDSGLSVHKAFYESRDYLRNYVEITSKSDRFFFTKSKIRKLFKHNKQKEKLDGSNKGNSEGDYIFREPQYCNSFVLIDVIE